MRAAEVLCAGVIVADHVCAPIPRLPNPGELILADDMLLTIGGCAANVAVDLAKMQVPSVIVGRVGNDPFGTIVRRMLEQYGIDTRGVCLSPKCATSQTMIINVVGQDRRFIHIFGANADFTVEDMRAFLTPHIKVLYLGGYLLLPGLDDDALAELFRNAQAAGTKVVLDVAVPGPADYLSRLRKVLPYVDVFLPNQDEAEVILGERDPVRQAERFRELGVGTAVITLGGDGAVLVSPRERYRVGVFPVPLVDGSGGGDAFDAGFIYGLLRGYDALGCLRVASALGASCVRAVGTTPGVFTEQECLEFLRQHELPVHKL
ncbi:MAG: carbohydrate kinase family protein [Gemmatales bacterium]|nr:carbohydrate kinase family protein [Gemmatales bacterium]MDW7993563.1 carbohydrate kinase family protein [Gemmatales bacterium]